MLKSVGPPPVDVDEAVMPRKTLDMSCDVIILLPGKNAGGGVSLPLFSF